MKVHDETLTIATRGTHDAEAGGRFVDITARVADIVARSKVVTGLCSVFVQHTSASLVIQENADPRVLADLGRWMAKLAPEGGPYEHDDEGPDDMPGHLRSAITKTSETVPVRGGRLALGTWQAIYLWEHRRRAHERKVMITVIGV
ncbi:MAG: secondary thiamine-phosphate synthase enzyme YjbQ [Polyangiaceae bacterium]